MTNERPRWLKRLEGSCLQPTSVAWSNLTPTYFLMRISGRMEWNVVCVWTHTIHYIKCCTLWTVKCHLASIELLEESLSHSQRQFLHCISVPLAGDMGSDQVSGYRCNVIWHFLSPCMRTGVWLVCMEVSAEFARLQWMGDSSTAHASVLLWSVVWCCIPASVFFLIP